MNSRGSLVNSTAYFPAAVYGAEVMCKNLEDIQGGWVIYLWCMQGHYYYSLLVHSRH